MGGCSAGGLGIFLGLDQMALQIRSFFAQNSTSQPQSLAGAEAEAGAGAGAEAEAGRGEGAGAEGARRPPLIVGFADSGFFMRYTSDSKWKLRKKSGGGTGGGGPDPAGSEAIVNGNMDYQSAMREVYRFMNISSGANPRCIKFALQNADYDVPGHDRLVALFPSIYIFSTCHPLSPLTLHPLSPHAYTQH